MTNTYLFMGFPGLIADSLVRQLIKETKDIKKIYLFAFFEQIEAAEKELNTLISETNTSSSMFELISGDITSPALGIDSQTNEELRKSVNFVYHSAGLNDLSASKDSAFRANVIGTLNINNLVLSLQNLNRYSYFSTAYISGTREGEVLETELHMNQNFKNYFERSKFQAELLVESLKEQIPITIFRPGAIKGHSVTGVTSKFDQPYYILNLFNALRKFPFIPYAGKGEAAGNFVPIDYVVKSAIFLSHSDKGSGKTYHITDPRPYKMREVYRMLLRKYLRKEPIGTLPPVVVKAILSFPFLSNRLKVEGEFFNYFYVRAAFDSGQTEADLKGSGIWCPDFADVITPMVRYYQEAADTSSKDFK